MAFKPGYLGHFSLDNAAGSLTNLSSYFDSVDYTYSVESLDVSPFGTAAKSFIPGLQGGDTITISGPYDVTAYSHVTALLAAQTAGTASHSYQWGPGGSVASQAKITGECLVSSLTPPSTVGGRAEFSVTLQLTGAATFSTF